MIHSIRLIALAAAACLLVQSAAQGAIITQPTGLSPGDQYRLVFLTSTARDATSTDIADYNTFVTGVATAVPQLDDLGTTWTAIASTAAVDARDNTSTTTAGVPIYGLDDLRVAADNTDLWDGSLENRIWTTENGSIAPGVVWTGTQTDGFEFAGSALGELAARNGVSVATDTNWVDSGDLSNDLSLPMYAISGILIAEAVEAVPEPSTWALGMSGLAAMAGALRRRRLST